MQNSVCMVGGCFTSLAFPLHRLRDQGWRAATFLLALVVSLLSYRLALLGGQVGSHRASTISVEWLPTGRYFQSLEVGARCAYRHFVARALHAPAACYLLGMLLQQRQHPPLCRCRSHGSMRDPQQICRRCMCGTKRSRQSASS